MCSLYTSTHLSIYLPVDLTPSVRGCIHTSINLHYPSIHPSINLLIYFTDTPPPCAVPHYSSPSSTVPKLYSTSIHHCHGPPPPHPVYPEHTYLHHAYIHTNLHLRQKQTTSLSDVQSELPMRACIHACMCACACMRSVA